MGGNLYGNHRYHLDKLLTYQNIISETSVKGNIKFKVTGLTDYFSKTDNCLELKLVRVSDGNYEYKQFRKDGEYNIELPTSKYSKVTMRSGGADVEDGTCNIDIEMLPEYPDALVFDGVDDYGVNENMPILEDFTLIINKNDIAIPELIESFYISKSGSVGNGAFILGFSKKRMYYSSYGIYDLYDYKKDPILYITPNSFNGSVLSKGSAPDTEILTIGTIRPNDNRAWKGAIYSAYLFDRSLDEQEIKSFIRKYIDPEYLLPSEQIPNPDVYYDFTNGDNSKGEANNVITDLSGNGNDATAHNFAWNEESGYAEGGGLKFDGVDDYITLNNTDNTNIYYKTVIGVATCHKDDDKILYDQRNFAIQTHNSALFYDGILYYERNNINEEKCLTYINGKLNKRYSSTTLINKKHCFAVTFDDAEFDTIRKNSIRISSTATNNFFINMNMYKFIAFKDRLTEEQIQCVIKKYNLLDGVDEIKVS